MRVGAAGPSPRSPSGTCGADAVYSRMPLDITPLASATARLREALARHRSEPLDELLRDGLIQRFEFTYELSHKTLRRYLQESAPSSEEVARMSFAELIRAGTAQGLLHAEWPTWRHFRDICTRTTHTYDADTAAAVVAEIPSFLEEVEYLCDQLRRRQE
jgi:nucleotidyltransferase substrate binding protein (TIGR01987 family)